MEPRKRILSGVMALIVFAAITASALAQEKARVDGQVRIALAEQYLFDFYKKSKSARKTGGVVGIGGGVLFMGLGVALMEGEDDWMGINDYFGGMSVVLGGAMVIAGGAALAFPSPAEKTYGRILSIEDPVRREQACADALAKMARSGRRMRMIGGGVTLATGALILGMAAGEGTSGAYVAGAALFAGAATYQFLVKSRPEKVYKAYLDESQVKPTPRLAFGLGPRGTWLVGLTMDW